MSNDFTEIQVDFSRGVSVLNLKALSMLKFWIVRQGSH